jgi:protein TonB
MMRGMLVLFFTVSVCAAGIDPAGEQELTSAGNLVDIRAADAKPFQLEISFSAQSNFPQDGHLTMKWAAKDLWRLQVTMGDYQQLEVRKGDTRYISRNGRFTPIRISELLDLVAILPGQPEEWEVNKVKHGMRDGSESDCLEVRARSRHLGNSERQVCIDRTTKEVLSIDVKDGSDVRRKEFADYQGFRTHRYPQQLTLTVNGSVALKAQVVSLREASFDEGDFVPPPGAIVRRQCENMTVPVPIKTPDPAYPRSAAQNRMMGNSVVSLTVLPNGSVDNVQLIGSAGHEMDQVTKEIIKTWKFKPAMCGNEAVAYDIRVDMRFRLE